MTDFVSTRGYGPTSLRAAVLGGMAPDGGLYVPREIPDAQELLDARRADASFADTARLVSGLALPGLDSQTARRLAGQAATFDVPVVPVEENRYVLELHHGPSHAFKDVGARFMAELLLHFSAGDRVTVLVATSGDTGGAVAQAFRNVEGVRVVVLFPERGVTELQRLQMTTVGGSVSAVAVDGTFDDCQRMAKESFADPELVGSVGLTSANSINVGRLLPQTLYYVHGASSVRERTGCDPVFVVPSGNLGNLCAGLIGMRSGAFETRFIAAANANRGFIDFLDSGSFRTRATQRTVSNAMDVAVPSNLERIKWLYRNDPRSLRGDVQGVWIDDTETLETMRAVYERTGYVLDPHTAVAYAAAERHSVEDRPLLILATAHPAKFAHVVEHAIGVTPDLPIGLRFPSGSEREPVRLPPETATLRPLLEAVWT